MFKFHKYLFFFRTCFDLKSAVFLVNTNSPTGKPTIHLFNRLRFQLSPECIRISCPTNIGGVFVDFVKNFFSNVLYIGFFFIRCISRHVLDEKWLSLGLRVTWQLLFRYKYDISYISPSNYLNLVVLPQGVRWYRMALLRPPCG